MQIYTYETTSRNLLSNEDTGHVLYGRGEGGGAGEIKVGGGGT